MIRMRTYPIQLYNKYITFTATRCISDVELVTKAQVWRPVIGLEIHAQIATESKLFSGASTRYGGLTNNQVSLLDASIPGTLPVLNRKCVEAGVKTALALNCDINMVSYFDRKHYFYADLPAGYQITQQRQPLATRGRLSYVAGNDIKTAGIWQLQLEQDSGKSLHDTEQGLSLIDLNRAGVGLMEIVTAPDFENADDAAEFVKELQLVLRMLGTCDCKMEEGSLRVDASISLHKPEEPLGVRTEIKNLNSIKFIKKAIEYEITRQQSLLNRGELIESETRSFDPTSDTTVAMRDKEKVHDYRFMPEPNLLPLRLHDNSSAASEDVINVEVIQESLPLLPGKRRELLIRMGIDVQHAVKLVNEIEYWDTFTELCKKPGTMPNIVNNLLMQGITPALVEKNISFSESEITVKQIGDIIDGLQSKKISRLTAQKLIVECLDDERLDVAEIVRTRKWHRISDPQQIANLCDQIIKNNPEIVKKYKKSRKDRFFQPLVHRVIQTSEGLVEPSQVKETLTKMLLEHEDPKS